MQHRPLAFQLQPSKRHRQANLLVHEKLNPGACSIATDKSASGVDTNSKPAEPIFQCNLTNKKKGCHIQLSTYKRSTGISVVVWHVGCSTTCSMSCADLRSSAVLVCRVWFIFSISPLTLCCYQTQKRHTDIIRSTSSLPSLRPIRGSTLGHSITYPVPS